jgi:hypothetical protein
MNERIRELKGMTLDKHFSYTWTTMDYDDVSRFAEKFAELIVRECCLLTEEYQHRVTFYRADETIKKHFGVKE